ncbi:MAG: hypothetical protein AB7K24_14010 [Gemmataceae bacterium]
MGRFLAILLVVVALVAGLGFYLGWFDVSRQSGNDRTDITLQINKDKVKEDTNKAVESAKETGRKIKEGAQQLVSGKSVTGTVASVDAVAGTMSVDTGAAEPVKFTMMPETKVKTDTEAKSMDDLSPEQKVTVAYHEDKNGARIADTITIEQP